MSRSESSFSEEVIDHFLHPRNVGTLDNASASVELVNEICGDSMQMSAISTGGKIAAIKFRSRGCAVAVAAASKLTVAVVGSPIAEADQRALAAVASVRDGTHGEKQHCLEIVLRTWRELLEKMS